jgi:hypothetical protein
MMLAGWLVKPSSHKAAAYTSLVTSQNQPLAFYPPAACRATFIPFARAARFAVMCNRGAALSLLASPATSFGSAAPTPRLTVSCTCRLVAQCISPGPVKYHAGHAQRRARCDRRTGGSRACAWSLLHQSLRSIQSAAHVATQTAQNCGATDWTRQLRWRHRVLSLLRRRRWHQVGQYFKDPQSAW